MQRLYRAKNGVVDGSDFWISDSAQPRRGKAKASDARKQEANRNQAAHILGRKLNNNFEQGDLFLTLTWDDTNWRKLRTAAYKTLEKGSREKAEVKRDAMLFEAEKEGKLFIRRVREAGAKNCKYMILASDMDGDTKDPARVHVHIIISGESVTQEQKQLRICGRTLEGFWPFGDADYEYLRDGSYSRLAAYLIKQTRDIKHHKKYACSRNLEPIEYEDIEVRREASRYMRRREQRWRSISTIPPTPTAWYTFGTSSQGTRHRRVYQSRESRAKSLSIREEAAHEQTALLVVVGGPAGDPAIPSLAGKEGGAAVYAGNEIRQKLQGQGREAA